MGVMNAQNWKAVQKASINRITMEHYQLKHRLCLYGNMGKKLFSRYMIGFMRDLILQRPRRCWDRIFMKD